MDVQGGGGGEGRERLRDGSLKTGYFSSRLELFYFSSCLLLIMLLILMKVASFIILVAVVTSRYLDYANTTNLSAVSKEKRLQNEANVCTNFRLCIFLFCNKISKALFKGNIFTIFYCLSSQKYFSLPFLFFWLARQFLSSYYYTISAYTYNYYIPN